MSRCLVKVVVFLVYLKSPTDVLQNIASPAVLKIFAWHYVGGFPMVHADYFCSLPAHCGERKSLYSLFLSFISILGPILAPRKARPGTGQLRAQCLSPICHGRHGNVSSGTPMHFLHMCSDGRSPSQCWPLLRSVASWFLLV
jgi:hypothetical protein